MPQQERPADHHRLGPGRQGASTAWKAAIFIAGAAVQWLRDELKIIDNAAETEALATSVQRQRRRLLRAGLRRPGRAVLGPVRPRHDRRPDPRHGRADIARATLEAIAYQTRDVLDAMEADCGVALNELRVDGGWSPTTS